MRVLIICYEFPPLGGGGARVVAGFARQLVNDGHEVDILTSGWKNLPARTMVDGATLHRIWTLRTRADRSSVLELSVYIAAMLPALRQLLKTRPYDVCNCHFVYPDGLLTPALKFWSNIPVVITAHGSDVPGYNPERFRLLHRLLVPLWRRIVNTADLIVCPSPTLHDLVRAQNPSTPTVVIPNGFNPGRFKPQPVRAQRILVVTRLFARKGIQHLIRAFAGLNSEYELLIVGDGPRRAELEALARDLDPRIQFTGWLDNDSTELKSLYESAAIFILPSEAENFPVSLLEAMAGGAAIITTRGTGCQDVVGDTALLVEAGDVAGLRNALQRLTTDEALRTQLAQAGRKRMESEFAWPRISQCYMDAFTDLAVTGTRAPETE